jgi:hypothetical protein
MRRGFEVYRAVSPAARSDLAVMVSETQLLRLEVAQGYTRIGGGYGGTPTTKRLSIGRRFDIVATVYRDGSIVYDPDILPAKGTRFTTP